MYIGLSISVLLNFILIWYIVKLLRNLVDVTQEFDNISVIMTNFSNHLKTVYEKETYYGDKTLEALVTHMKVVDESINSYTNMLVLFEDEIGEKIDDNEESNQEG
tara:strand:- start:595 stop:909 length:315 start_codon:yes stop_codon:yes gene_type:complete